MKYFKHHIFKTILFISIIVCGCKDNLTNVEQPKIETDYGTYDISTYMPLSIGNRWIYDVTSVAEKAVLDRRIKDSVRVSHQLLMFSFGEDVLVYPPATSQITVGYYGQRGGTIYFADLRGPLSCPLFPLLASPIVVNHTWWTDARGQRDTLKIISVSSGSFINQSIDTIVAVRRWHEGIVDTTWYARTIGILKETSHSDLGSTTTRQLSSFSPTP